MQTNQITVNEYQKRLSFLDKILLTLNTIKSPYKIILDKLNIASEIKYETKDGIRFFARSKSTDINEGIVVLSGYEYPSIFFGNMPKNSTIIDCGGNIGFFALYVKKIFPDSRVISIEPLPANIVQYEKNLKINSNMNNVELIPKGISVNGEDLNFLLEGNHFDGVHSVEKETEHTLKIKTITLESLIKEYDLENIDILKVDIEGGEFQLLTNGLDLLKDKVSKIIVEHHTKVEPDGRNILVEYLTKDNAFQLSFETTNLLVFTNDKNSIAEPNCISIIVPTKNSSKNMIFFFDSLLESEYKKFEVIVNDDLNSIDNLEKLCSKYIELGLDIKYIKENISMAQGRLSGSKYASGEILLHLDSDMRLSQDLLGECADKISQGFDALVIPETSFGIGFWAKVKWLEKKCYNNVEWMESLRCIKKDVYDKLGGHNEKMIFSEDKDLDIRVKEGKYLIGRTKNNLLHNEGNLKLVNTMKKKMGYSKTANVFKEIHPGHYAKQGNLFLRYVLYVKNIRYLFTHPILYMGLFILKTFEFSAAVLGMLKNKLSK